MESRNIQMCDLKGQYTNIKPEIDAAIQQVIESTAFIKGAEVGRFQDELAKHLGVKHAIGCANGTDALQIALMALGLKPGDEVITPNFTFIATVEVVALLGMTPVLVDVDPTNFTIDTKKLEEAITPRTRAIIPVHLFGQCANMDEIMRIAKKHGIFVVEDNAQALGADYYPADGVAAKAGTVGDIGTTSFFPSKNLGCYGDGGALFTNNDDLASEIRSIANHGMKVRYHHERIGVNSRLDTIQAAVLSVKLKHLEQYNAARVMAANFYDSRLKACPQLVVPGRVKWSNHIFHQYTLKTVGINRDDLVKHLAAFGIPSMVYYPIPLHRQKAFEPYRAVNGSASYPVSDALAASVISLPMHTELDESALTFICDKVLSFFK